MLLSWFGSKTQQKLQTVVDSQNTRIVEQQQQRPTLLGVLRKQVASLNFWLHLTSRSLLMVFVSFLLFVPTYMKHAYAMTSSTAAQVGSVFALGCLASVTVGSKPYSTYTTKQRTALIFTLLTCATLISLAQLAHVSGTITISPIMGTLSMFLWGFMASLPFYIPPSLYALEQGGSVSSATIADFFDIGGFLVLALFNGHVAGIRHSILSQWKGTFVFTTTCSAIALCSLTLATVLDGGWKGTKRDDTSESSFEQ